MKTIIYNADIANEGRLTRGYIVIDDEIIAEVGEGEPAAAVMAECDVRNDVDGALVMPGVIDDQVHFRDPGLTHKADIATESAAAVAGGVTSYMDMPNTVPPTVTIDALEAKNRRAQEVSVANYGFFIGATNDNLKTLMAVDYSYTPGVKLFLGASTGNMLVSDRDALHDIFAEVPALVAIHSEDEQLIRRNREFYIKKYGDDLPVKFHPLIRSTEVCYKSTARAVEWAEKYGTRLHVLHVSTARELELFDNRPLLEKKITAEVCVHHLWFTDDDYPYKMEPRREVVGRPQRAAQRAEAGLSRHRGYRPRAASAVGKAGQLPESGVGRTARAALAAGDARTGAREGVHARPCGAENVSRACRPLRRGATRIPAPGLLRRHRGGRPRDAVHRQSRKHPHKMRMVAV